MDIVQKTSAHNTTAKAGRNIEYLVVHYTAGTTSRAGAAANVAAYFASTDNQASADFIVDDETAVQYNPDLDNRYCWHCGGSRLNTKGGGLYGACKNANSIGVELCSTNSSGKAAAANDGSWSFTQAVLERGSALLRELMERYGIDAEHVIRHYDVTGKLCPGIVGWNADSGDESLWTVFHAGLGAGGTQTVTAGEPAEKSNEEDEEMNLSTFKQLWSQLRAELQDNDASAYSQQAREWAVAQGLVSGISDGEFNGAWQDYLTREQLVTVLYRFAQTLGQG
ncbi:MAG: N-acetylmuramoyl-L-alanine amidase [Oscillospiraceae bacterium]|nr:N-acetylmuramoyl-L-alanine amidase [Oscillospiraceae bacterium]